MAFKKLKLWFDKDLAKMLAQKIYTIDKHFDKNAFITAASKGLNKLELKDRVEHFADQLDLFLGNDSAANIETLMQILGPENEEETGMFNNFYWIMPISKYVEKYGLQSTKLSFNAIEEITKRNTGEYAIRPFIEKHEKKTLKQMIKWSKSSNRHVRRLSSEGVRPRLPWATKLQCYIDNPRPILPILENLKDDNSKYVQKSVANCINDILKDNLEIGQELLSSWAKNPGHARRWIIKHALRNLKKQKNEWALNLIQSLT